MPIKFRCDYCRQLMGIAHSKAGSLVDCPTCGRTLRVPNQDGTVDPPPTPGVDLADDGLRRALDELAQIGQPDDEPNAGPRPFLPDPSSLVAKPGTSLPQPPTAPAQALPSAPTIVAPVAKPTVQLVNSLALEALPLQPILEPPLPPRSASAGGSPPVQSVSLAGASPEQILAGLANQQVPPRSAAVVVSAPIRVVQGYSLLSVVLIGVLSFVAGIAGGWVLGHRVSPLNPSGSPENGAAPIPAAAFAAKPLVKGRITYLGPQNHLEPDVGACVILLPMNHQGATKLTAQGLRPNDDEVAHTQAAKQLTGQGGRLAVVDEEGNFRADLPQAGDYRLIVLSHFHGRPKDPENDVAALKDLEEFFDRPAQLVGQLAFEVAEIKHKGSGTVIWDHAFR